MGHVDADPVRDFYTPLSLPSGAEPDGRSYYSQYLHGGYLGE